MTRAREQPIRIVAAGDRADWRWQLEYSVRRIEDLDPNQLGEGDRDALRRASARFPMAITPYYLSLIDPRDPNDPLRRMVVPAATELARTDASSDDPIGEQAHSPMPGLIRRYPDRALLLVSGACPTVCRHCTRRILGRGRIAPLDRARLDRGLGYLAEHPEIRDVILSGGDPLILEDDELDRILAAVRSVPSVETVRVATRAPVTLPMRVTDDLAALLARHGPVYLATQFNHPREVTAEAAVALARLADAGIPLVNQAVLLRGVNDSPDAIEQLCRALLSNRVRPYYLFMCDLVTGTEHFRTSIKTGVEIMEHLRGRLSGLAIPQLVVDLPGGRGKVPIGPDYVVRREGSQVILRAPDGAEVPYPDPPEPLT
jgi:lysine 2,3-aminomutase